jgi:hypothetical protein
MTETKAVATTTFNYPALQTDIQFNFKEIFEANLNGMDVSPRKLLTTISMPTQGGTIFSYTTIDGDVSTKELSGVIIHIQPERAKFVGEYGENKFPECTSPDGITGEGKPGGECVNCPDNQFGLNNKAKPCKEVKMIYMLTQDDVLPIGVRCTTGSFEALKNYGILLMRKGLDATKVETIITLEATKNQSGIKYSKLNFAMKSKIDDDLVIQKIKNIKKEFLPLFTNEYLRKTEPIDVTEPIVKTESVKEETQEVSEAA